MKTKFKKNGRRLLAAILCLVMAVMALPMSAFAWTSEEGVSCTSSFGDYYVGSDGGYYRSKSSYSFIVYDSDGNTSVRTISAGNAKRKYLMTDGSGTHQVYCVESGIDFNTGNSYVSQNGKNSSYFRKLPTEAQFGVMMALMYGWHEGKSSPVAGTNTDDYAFATQTIIWEYQQQLRTSPSDLHSANGIDADTYCYSLKGRPAEKCYDWILSQMASHYTIPSFAARNQNKADTYTLKYNPDKQNYSLTLTDTNNTLANLSLSASGIKVSRSGNQYTFTSDNMITSPITVSAQKAVNLDCDEMLIWGCVGKQTMVSGASDPVYFYFKLDTETYGTGLIKKTSEDGVVSGIKFNISGNGVNQTVVTKADGTVDISLMPGVYTVTEQPIDRYEPQSVQRITIVSGHTSTVTFSNTLKRGSLEIIKSSEDNLVEGVKFHLYGTSLSGLPVDEYAVTDANGVARFENVLISGAAPYTVEEIDTAVRYVIPASQTAPIEWEKVTSRSFTNILKKFNVTVTKSDAEMGTAQGDASLAGAVYGIYKDEELIDTYTTDKNGQFTTKYYVCGNDWTVREISPSEGYLLDRTIHKVGAEPELYTVEFNSTANDVTEQVIKGNIAIIKHTDNGETQIETPETGAAFEVFRKAAGSFDAAKETERDILTCDENGFAQTKDMPYGIYTVRQTSGWEGRELMKPMEEANAFLSVKLRTAKTIAYAAFLCIVSPIALLILGAISESTVGVLNENIAGGIGMIVLIILVAIAAVMFISSGSKTAPFAYLEKEKFETEYGVSGMVKERKAQYKDLHTKHNIAGACLCVTALIPLFVGAIIDADNDLFLTIMLSLSFLIAGVGVICFIKTGIIWASYEKLLQEGEYSKENKEKPSFSGAIYTAYWVIATAVYLGYSLSSNNWGQSWIIWVVAGVIFPAVIAITNAFEKKSK